MGEPPAVFADQPETGVRRASAEADRHSRPGRWVCIPSRPQTGEQLGLKKLGEYAALCTQRMRRRIPGAGAPGAGIRKAVVVNGEKQAGPGFIGDVYAGLQIVVIIDPSVAVAVGGRLVHPRIASPGENRLVPCLSQPIGENERNRQIDVLFNQLDASARPAVDGSGLRPAVAGIYRDYPSGLAS